MKPIIPTAAFAALILCGLCGCGSFWPWGNDSDEVSQIPDDVNFYVCSDDKHLMLRYDEHDKSVMVVFPEREFRLDRVSSSAEKKYSNGRATLTNEGGLVALEESGATLFAGCKPDPAFPPPRRSAAATSLGVPAP